MNTPIQASSAVTHGAILVICNCPDTTSADRLAQGLVENRLAACVNQLGPVRSTYRWEGRIESAQEFPLFIKTAATLYPQLQRWLAEQHPYDTPEIIALPISEGLPAYLAWLNDEVNA